MLDNTALRHLWDEAEGMDRTLSVNTRQLQALKRKLVRPEPFSRHKMFLKMAKRKAVVFRDVPVLINRLKGTDANETLIRALSKRFPPKETSRVQVGPSHTATRLPVREIMRRWLNGRAIVGVTDLHIRETRVEEVIDTDTLSNFNTLIRGSDDLARQEMMTLVIASRGNVTDSHSDDPDGTNHCFFGKKLWLAWDTFEGMASGLEDVERQDVYGQCKFNMTKFLKLKSACWFLVSTGETLFLPGNLTHKVLTFEPYIGVGSFHVGLPSSLDSFTRWIYHGPLWSISDHKRENERLVDEAAKITLRIVKRAAAGSQRIRDRWGYDYMYDSYRTWKNSVTPRIRDHVLEHSTFREIVEIARSTETSQSVIKI